MLRPALSILFAGWLLALTLSGCGAPLLANVRLEPHQSISPNADGVDDLTMVRYVVGRAARVTIVLEDADGQRHLWREGEPRAPGQYEAWFSGVINGRLLPDGSYRLTVRAEPTGGGPAQSASVAVTQAGGESVAPEIQALAVTPRRISPNADGIADEATITYALSKKMARLALYLLGPDGRRYALPPDLLHEPGDAGSHLHRFDGGVGLGAVPPPDGDYQVVLEAQDAVGATAVATTTLTLAMGGLPLAELTRHDVAFSSESLLVGDTLFFTTTVTNVGLVPIRTQGPEPGTLYGSGQNYNNLDAPISDGAWRLGLDFEGNPVYNGRRYPYRWQLGADEELTEMEGERYLMPGQSVTISGGLRMEAMPPRERPGFWVGLIHENVRFVEDFVGTTYITIDGTPDAPTLLEQDD